MPNTRYGWISPDIEASISQCVTDCTWLVRREQPGLALELRNEFTHEWEIEEDHWNDAVDVLIDYVDRKGETPEISIRQLMTVRFPRASKA